MEKFTDRQIEIMEAATARIDKYGIQNLTTKNLAADLDLSEPALYRHFKNKNEILLGLLHYFITEMKSRLNGIFSESHATTGDELRDMFSSQLQAFTRKPSIVSVIFSENIFHFNKELSTKVSEIMELMHQFVNKNIVSGQKSGEYSKLIAAGALSTIIIGSIRLTVLKWKLSGHKSNLVKDGTAIVEGILKMIEKN